MPRTAAILLCTLLALASACAEKDRVTAPALPANPAPVANSPANAVRRLEWAWKERNCDTLATCLTEDFVFAFALGDSAGNPYRDVPWTREDELAASCSLFAQAVELDLDFDRTLIALPDDRPGKHPTWHKSIRTKVNLRAVLDRGGGPEVFEINGYAKFYLARGDSAAIPPELVARGFGPDSTRWWIDRWEDETHLSGGASAHPTRQFSWGMLKALFR